MHLWELIDMLLLHNNLNDQIGGPFAVQIDLKHANINDMM